MTHVSAAATSAALLSLLAAADVVARPLADAAGCDAVCVGARTRGMGVGGSWRQRADVSERSSGDMTT